MDGQTKEGIREQLSGHFGDDILFADGFDSAIVGIACGHDSGRVVYDYEKMIASCMKEAGMTYEDSVEWIEYNTISAYVGEQTPIYLHKTKDLIHA